TSPSTQSIPTQALPCTMRSSAMTKSAAAWSPPASVAAETSATAATIRPFLIFSMFLLPTLVAAIARRRGAVRLGGALDDDAVLAVERSAGRHAFQRLGAARFAAVVQPGPDLDLLVAGSGQLIRIGAVFHGAEPAQVDRRRAALGMSAGVKIVRTHDGQRDI